MDSLQRTTRIHQDMTTVLYDIFRVISSLNLHPPLLSIFLPKCPDDLVIESDILAQAVLVCHALEVPQNFGRRGIAMRRLVRKVSTK